MEESAARMGWICHLRQIAAIFWHLIGCWAVPNSYAADL